MQCLHERFELIFRASFLSSGEFFSICFFLVLGVSRINSETRPQGCLWHWAGGNSMKALNPKRNACHCCWHLELPGLCMNQLLQATCWEVSLMNRYYQADSQRSIIRPLSRMVPLSACPRVWSISPVLRPRGSSASGDIFAMQI